MQNAETVLGILRDRGRRGLPCNELYRQLFNPQMFLMAYGRIYSNQGAMTPGPCRETADGMSLAKIESIIDILRNERYRFQPVKRVYIPKKDGRTRPLGLPSWSDKLVGEVVRLLLEAYYEPQLSDRSHGFRPDLGCHTALSEIQATWTGTTWFIEGDISDCFGSLNHATMLAMLGDKIHDNRFLRLIKQMLQAGYLEDWKWHATPSGTPQGGVLSPLLSNIYLDRLDKYVETVLMPRYSYGTRRNNPDYQKVARQIAKAKRNGDRVAVRLLRRRRRRLPRSDPYDTGYRRLRYIRYADDHILGFTGPKAEADQIKSELASFLRDELKLELCEEKTLITHARTSAARFLGYEITVQHCVDRPTANGKIWLRVPESVIRAKCAPYLRRGKPEHLPHLKDYDDHSIIGFYGAEYRGIVQYYLLAGNAYRLNRLEWVAKTSMLKTLAARHNSTVTKMARKYRTKVETPYGLRTCFEASIPRAGRKPLIARFGGIPLKRQEKAVIIDRQPSPYPRPKELVTRLRAGWCELCGRRDKVEVHQIAKLSALTALRSPQPAWAQVMAQRRRKTLVVCGSCHGVIHANQPTAITK